MSAQLLYPLAQTSKPAPRFGQHLTHHCHNVITYVSCAERKKKEKKPKGDDSSSERTGSVMLHRSSTTFSSQILPQVPVVEAENSEADQNKRRWIAHMILGVDGVTDPPGIKLRPIETIHGIMYLDPGAITNALSYVFGPLVETLWVGQDSSLFSAGYYHSGLLGTFNLLICEIIFIIIRISHFACL